MSDTFLVPFQGETLACKTGLDAVAVKLADAVLTGRERAVSPNELRRLASVLEKYDRHIAAYRMRCQYALSP
jgi:hypothetical protein